MEFGSSLECLEFDLEGIDPNNPVLTPDLIAELDELSKDEVVEMIEELEEFDLTEEWEIATLKVLKEYQVR